MGLTHVLVIFWPPIMSNHTPLEELVNRGVQHANEPGMLVNALFPKDQCRESTRNFIHPSVATVSIPENRAGDIPICSFDYNGPTGGPKISSPLDTRLSQDV